MSNPDTMPRFKNEIGAGINWYVACCVDGEAWVPRQHLLKWRDAAYAAETEIERLREALTQAEACMSIVAPRSDTAEYLRILGVIRAALARPAAAEETPR